MIKLHWETLKEKEIKMRSNKKSIKDTQLKRHLLHLHKFYNLLRYLFLNIEWNYNKYVEKNNITLPQLRVLWITALFCTC